MDSFSINPKEREIWLVDFNSDSKETEIDAISDKKDSPRPAIVLSINPLLVPRSMQIVADSIFYQRVVIPLKSRWENDYENLLWFVKVKRDSKNCLDNDSTAEILQIRSCDKVRFKECKNKMQPLGEISHDVAKEILIQLAICLRFDMYFIVSDNKSNQTIQLSLNTELSCQ